MNENGPVVSVEELSVRYGRTVAVDQVSLRVLPGEVYALLGRNGAGKSSLMRCLLGQLKPYRGETRLLGLDSWRSRARIMERVGVVPETPDMPPESTANRLVPLFRRLYARWDEQIFNERMRRFAIDRKTPCSGLSKGQRRQLGLALALGSKPELLLMDDPTLGLDVVARKELYEELISELADRGTSVFLTTHDLAGIEGIATRVGIMSRGRLLVDVDLEELKQRFRRVRLPRVEAQTALAAALETLQPVITREDQTGTESIVKGYHDTAEQELVAACQGKPMRIEPVSLEDIFIALVGGVEDDQ